MYVRLKEKREISSPETESRSRAAGGEGIWELLGHRDVHTFMYKWLHGCIHLLKHIKMDKQVTFRLCKCGYNKI